MLKRFHTPLNKYYFSFFIQNVQSLAIILKIVFFISFIYTFHCMMDINDKVNPIEAENAIQDQNHKDKNRSIEYPSEQNTSKNINETKNLSRKKSKEADMRKNKSSTSNRPTYQRKYFWPPAPPKRKPAPVVSIHMSNPAAEIVLQERKVEIKDLESQVAYLQNQIKELKTENKTLLDVQNRQSKELKKYFGGCTDLPTLIRSHNDEIKATQSNASAIRKELRVCQNDLKSKSELLLRKDQELNKLKHALKINEQNLQELSLGNRKLKRENKKFADETKKLESENEELKSKTEMMEITIQQLTNKTSDLEETLSKTKYIKMQLKEDLEELQSKYNDALQNEIMFNKSLEVPKVMSSTQTEKIETAHAAIMTEICEESEMLLSEKVSIGVQVSEDEIYLDYLPRNMQDDENNGNISEEEVCHSSSSKDQFTAFDAYPDIFSFKESVNSKPPGETRRIRFCKPMYSFSKEIPKEASEVEKSYQNLEPWLGYAMPKQPIGLTYGKKTIPLSNSLLYKTSTSCDKEPLSKSTNETDTSLNLGFNTRKDNLCSYFKELTTENPLRKSSNRTENSLNCYSTGKKDIKNEIRSRTFNPSSDISLKSLNGIKSRKDLFSNLTSEENEMYPNG